MPLPSISAVPNLSRCTTAAIAMVAALTLAGCSSTPVAYQGLASAPQLRAVAADGGKAFEYRSPGGDLRRYAKLVIDPVTIYGDADAQFGSVSPEDRRLIADYMQQKFAEMLGATHRLVDAPEPGAARLHLTLAGIERSTPVLSTITHLAPIGLVINTGLQATDNNGTFFGSVTYAAELSDAVTGDLLYAYVTKETPDALDVTASLGMLDAARTGVRIGARNPRDDLAKGGFAGATPQRMRTASDE